MILERSVGGWEGGLDDEKWREVVVKERSGLGVVVRWWLSCRWSDSGMVLVNSYMSRRRFLREQKLEEQIGRAHV